MMIEIPTKQPDIIADYLRDNPVEQMHTEEMFNLAYRAGKEGMPRRRDIFDVFVSEINRRFTLREDK